METSADKLRAYVYAIGVHLACVALMFVGLLWTDTTKPVSVAGSVIEATLVSTATPSASAPRPSPPKPETRETAPKPQPKPEPKPQQAEEQPQPTPQAPIPDPAQVEQEKAAALALQQAEKLEREQEEKRRQEQVELEREKQEAEQRERLSEMERERADQLADIRRKREEAEKRRKLEEEKLRQLADARQQTQRDTPKPQPQEQPPADRVGNNGVGDDLTSRYAVAIQQAVQRNWLRPDSAQPGIRCTLRIVQIPGGEVIQASVTSPCNADDLTRRSIEAAVMKAQPLPYTGFESVFQRDIRFNFKYDG